MEYICKGIRGTKSLLLKQFKIYIIIFILLGVFMIDVYDIYDDFLTLKLIIKFKCENVLSIVFHWFLFEILISK